MTAMDAFFEECGGRDPLRVELWPRDGGTSVTVEFGKPYILVGRGPGADMGVDNDGTAMRQLYFQLVAGRLYAVQLSEDYPTHQGDDLWRSGWVMKAKTRPACSPVRVMRFAPTRASSC